MLPALALAGAIAFQGVTTLSGKAVPGKDAHGGCFGAERVARAPIWVIAHWPRAKLSANIPKDPKAPWDGKISTQIVITKVLRGDVKPGPTTLNYEFTGFDPRLFGPDGGDMEHLLPGPPGQAANMCDPSLWFLQPVLSGKKLVALHLPSYRCLQEVDCRPLFEALSSDKPEPGVTKCLQSRDPVLVERTLIYVAGDRSPEPSLGEPTFYEDQDEDRLPPLPKHPEYAESVREVADRGPGKCRAVATSVYAQLLGIRAVSFLNTKLGDRDPYVRLSACAQLASLQAASSFDKLAAICRRLSGLGLNTVALDSLIAMLGEKKDARLVPAIIPFLECRSGYVPIFYRVADPVFLAQDCLNDITDYTFPLDADTSLAAWQKVKDSEPKERADRLTQLLGDWEKPLQASIKPLQMGADGSMLAEVEMTNASTHRVAISNVPTSIWSSWAGDNSFMGFSAMPSGRKRVCLLQPKESARFQMCLPAALLKSGRPYWLEFRYFDDPPRTAKTWRGSVRVDLG